MKSNFFATIFVLFVLIFMAFAGWFYVFSKISSERKTIIELRKNILRGEKKNTDEKSLARLLGGIKKEKGAVDSVFLKKDDLIRLVRGLESIEENSGVSLEINAISTEKNKTSKPAISLPIISFSAKGTFEQLFKYLYFLENLPYLITINKVSFQSEEGGGGSVQADNKKINSTPSWQALFSIQLESYEN